MYGDGSIPGGLALLALAVSPESSTPCYPISALALALRLLSSEPHRIRRRRDEAFPSEGFSPTLARWGRVSSLTLEAYWCKVMTFLRVNGSPRVADFGSQGTAGSPILLPPPIDSHLSCHINAAVKASWLVIPRSSQALRTLRRVHAELGRRIAHTHATLRGVTS